jgi:hypothetical protein
MSRRCPVAHFLGDMLTDKSLISCRDLARLAKNGAHLLSGRPCPVGSGAISRYRTKHSVHSEIVAVRPEQKLKGPYRMSLVAVLYDWPRA